MSKNKTQKLFDRLPSEVVYSKEETEKIFEKMNAEISAEQMKLDYESFIAQKEAEKIFINS